MCKNDQNDSYLDSLVDSYAASQDSVEKKLETFAQSRQISQRIARARLNEEDFTNKYHRSKKGEGEEEEPLITILNSNESQEEDEILENSPEEEKEIDEATKVIETGKLQPDFVGSSSSSTTFTKPLNNLQDLKDQSSLPSNSSFPTANVIPPLPKEDLEMEKDGLTIQFDPTSSSQNLSTSTRSFTPNQVDFRPSHSIESTKAIPTSSTREYLQSNQGYIPNDQPPRQGYSYPGSVGNEGGSTRVFNNSNGVPNGMNGPVRGSSQPNGFGNTISMTPGSIPRSISSPSDSSTGEEQGVKLKREYVNAEGRDSRSDEERRPRRTSNSRIYLTIGAIVASLVVLVVGGMFVKNYIEDTFHTSQNSSAYDELMAWAVDYPTYSDKQQKTITQWRVTFEKCTAEQKEKINNVLVSGTGKTFDELLAAAAASQSKESSISNENVAKAEKKAKLKDDMATIQAQITNLQNQLNGINGRIMEAEANYNTKNAAYMAAQNKVQSCQNALDSLNIQLNSLPNETTLQSQLSSLKAQLNTMSPTIIVGGNMDSVTSSEDDDSITTAPIAVPGTPSSGTSGTTNGSNAYNEEPNSNRTLGMADEGDDLATHYHARHYETAGTIVPNPEYQALQQEIANLENQIETLSSERFSLQVQISDAETALSEAQAAVPEAKSEADAAYGAWQALKSEVEPIQKQIDEKNAELAELQNEFDSIQ